MKRSRAFIIRKLRYVHKLTVCRIPVVCWSSELRNHQIRYTGCGYLFSYMQGKLVSSVLQRDMKSKCIGLSSDEPKGVIKHLFVFTPRQNCRRDIGKTSPRGCAAPNGSDLVVG